MNINQINSNRGYYIRPVKNKDSMSKNSDENKEKKKKEDFQSIMKSKIDIRV